jgi:choline dehydrogenase-like flavoprotein
MMRTSESGQSANARQGRANPSLLRPESRGFVRLKSTDPRDPPAIVQNFLSTQRHREVLRAGLGGGGVRRTGADQRRLWGVLVS